MANQATLHMPPSRNSKTNGLPPYRTFSPSSSPHLAKSASVWYTPFSSTTTSSPAWDSRPAAVPPPKECVRVRIG